MDNSEASFKQIESILAKKDELNAESFLENQEQGYGDLTSLNLDGLILKYVGNKLLRNFSDDYLELLGTSSAIYEINGDYSFGIFSSGWCRMMDAASRELCQTDDNSEALASGKWLCHDSCWGCSKKAMDTAMPNDIECAGGIRLYAEPIIVGGKVVGAINFGYGNPPQDSKKLHNLALTYGIKYEDIVFEAKEYHKRPLFIIEMAKRRLRTTALLIASIIEAKQAEEKIKQQLLEKEILLKEVHHRIKNNIVSIEGLLSMQANATENHEVKNALFDAIARIQGIRVLYEKLLLGDDYQEVSIKSYIESLIESAIEVFSESKKVTIEHTLIDFTLNPSKIIPIGIIINEILTNIFKYAFNEKKEGRIHISLDKKENHVTLIIHDDGCGINKRKKENQTPGFGLTIVNMLAELMEGNFTIEDENGTKSTLKFEI